MKTKKFTLIVGLTCFSFVLFGCQSTKNPISEYNSEVTIPTSEETTDADELMEENSSEEFAEKKVLYQHFYYEEYNDGTTMDPFTEKLNYDEEGNYIGSEYSKVFLSKTEPITEVEFLENRGFDAFVGDFRYGAPESNANLVILHAADVVSYEYYESGEYGNCLAEDGRTVYVRVNDKKQIVEVTNSPNFDEAVITWDEDGNMEMKYLKNSTYYEKKAVNDRLVYEGSYRDEGFNAAGWHDASSISREYEYNDAGQMISQKYTDGDGNIYKYYYFYDDNGEIVACIEDDEDDGNYDFVDIFYCSMEYDDDGNLIKKEVGETLEVSEEEWETITSKSIEDLREDCIQISNNHRDDIRNSEDDLGIFVEVWEYKNLSEIIAD